jgi:hypothetical protein
VKPLGKGECEATGQRQGLLCRLFACRMVYLLRRPVEQAPCALAVLTSGITGQQAAGGRGNEEGGRLSAPLYSRQSDVDILDFRHTAMRMHIKCPCQGAGPLLLWVVLVLEQGLGLWGRGFFSLWRPWGLCCLARDGGKGATAVPQCL